MKKKYLVLALLMLQLAAGWGQSFGKNKVNAHFQEWSQIKSLHYDIYFPRGEDDFGRMVTLMAEEIYYYLKNELQYPVLSRIPLVFYANRSDFQVTNIIAPLLSEGVGGFTESMRNRVVMPFDGDYRALEKLMIHELTHAYINGLESRITSRIEALRPVAFPFWFSEGLPEYYSAGGKDPYNNMFVLDMVLSDKLPGLEYLDGYYAYRLGESFLAYIAETYGREKLSEYFYTLRSMNSLDEATKRVFAMDFAKLESRWKYQLKRKYYPYINSHKIAFEAYEKRTERDKEGSYFNFAPRFAPDGLRYAYFSDTGARYSVWLGSSLGLEKPRKLITGESSGKLEEFHYLRSNLSWFPDAKKLAFVAKSATGDQIHILDIDTQKISRSIQIAGLRSIYEIDVSPDGRRIALSAQKGMQTDIFIYELDTGNLQAITADAFADKSPRWHPDGNKLVFASQRAESLSEAGFGYFNNLIYKIFEYDLATGEMQLISSESFDLGSPFYAEGGKYICYLSYREGIANLEIVDTVARRRAKLSNILSGVTSADISAEGNYILLSNYFGSGWDLYFGHYPLKNLDFEDYPLPQLEDTQIFGAGIDIEQFKLFGPRKRKQDKAPVAANYTDPRRPSLSVYEPSYPDSALISLHYAWDERPDTLAVYPPQIKRYRPRFSLDSIWGGAAYSSGSGMMGSVELGFSDLMGDHSLGLRLGLSERLDESSIFVSYLNLSRRWDWGIGLYNLYDRSYYRHWTPEGYDYFRMQERQGGLYLLARYPFSRFMRLESDAMLYYYQRNWDYLPHADIEDNLWQNNVDTLDDTAFAPGISWVFDNALYGSTGPLTGLRANYTLRKGFAREHLDYLTNYVDIRKYYLFSKRYSLASRFNGAISSGKYPDRFSLGGFYGVRALPYNLAGQKKLLGTIELRYPLLDKLSIAFPLPLSISNIRGSAYMDIGAVWDENKYFRGAHEGVLQDIKLGYGFGPRLSLGYFVLKLDVAWLTNLSHISKPQIYLSLSDDF